MWSRVTLEASDGWGGGQPFYAPWRGGFTLGPRGGSWAGGGGSAAGLHGHGRRGGAPSAPLARPRDGSLSTPTASICMYDFLSLHGWRGETSMEVREPRWLALWSDESLGEDLPQVRVERGDESAPSLKRQMRDQLERIFCVLTLIYEVGSKRGLGWSCP